MTKDQEIEMLKAQLVEAVGLLSRLYSGYAGYSELEAFLACHAQVDQQEAQGAQAVDERAARAIYDADRSLFMTKREYSELNLQTKGRLLNMARAALATQPASSKPVATVLSSRPGNDTSTIDKALPDGTKLFLTPPAAALGDEYEIWSAAQLSPGEGIEDGAKRIRALIGKPTDHVDEES